MIFRHIGVFSTSFPQNEMMVIFQKTSTDLKNHIFNITYYKTTEEEK